MATLDHCQESENLEKVVVFGPPPFFPYIESDLSSKYHFLKPYESSLPLPDFLTTHNATAVRAIVASGGTRISAELLDLFPSLGVVLTTSAGVDKVDFAECKKRGIEVANSGEAYSEDVADLAVGLFIDVLRKISASDWYVRQGLWPSKGQYPLGCKLGGKRVGIVGLGRIGLKVAKRLGAFGCVISYSSRRKKPSVPYPFYVNAFELASRSDALIICCGLTDHTYHMINRDVMLALGKEGFIVNIGRGSIIDEKELVQCLQRGEIAGAGLDVFENEPDVPQELFTLDNVVMTPHCANKTPGSGKAVSEVVGANLEAFFSNKPLLYQIDKE